MRIFWFAMLPALVMCSSPQPKEQQMPRSYEKFKFLALGDSYTIGEKVPEKRRWPVQLADSLGIKEVRIIAETGWTTDELDSAIKAEQESLAPPYDLVSLLIGVNNQYRGYHFSQFEKEYTQLLKKAISLAGNDTANVFVLSIPDYGVTPFAKDKNPEKIAGEIARYNATKKKITNSFGVSFYDITPISKKAANDSSWLTEDQLHPSAIMYSEWVKLVKKQMQKTKP
ncbi:MAG: SGNH/GDSL hydrolase family protein [Bacteroidetes bacterium]|nr:SGNH/GDSL hydrolase family protein [Bacteroidota bacterium]